MESVTPVTTVTQSQMLISVTVMETVLAMPARELQAIWTMMVLFYLLGQHASFLLFTLSFFSFLFFFFFACLQFSLWVEFIEAQSVFNTISLK